MGSRSARLRARRPTASSRPFERAAWSRPARRHHAHERALGREAIAALVRFEGAVEPELPERADGGVQALIAARLDALAPADRALLQDAAVLGHSFTLAGLEAVTGETQDALADRLRQLGRADLVVQEVDPRSPERGMYAFVQALIRDRTPVDRARLADPGVDLAEVASA